MSIFSERLRERRKKVGITQEALAAAIGGYEKQTISGYERGINEPNYQTLCKIADALRCTTDYLLGRPGADAATKEAASVVEQTGLSAPAVDILIGFKNDRDGSYIQSISALISDILLHENVTGMADVYHRWKRLLSSPEPPAPTDIQMTPGQFENNAEKWRDAMEKLVYHDFIIAGARYKVTSEFEAFLSDIEFIAKKPGGFEGRIADIYREEALIKQFEEKNLKGDAAGIDDLLKNRRKDNGKGKE